MNIDIFGGLQIVTPPSAEPLSLAEVNSFLRLQPPGVDSEADSFIITMISTVRQHIEISILKRALLLQTWNLFLKAWPGRDYVNSQHFSGHMREYIEHNHIKIPLPPLRTINSISFITSSGTTGTITPHDPPVSTQTQNAVNVFTNVTPGQIVLPFSGIWPTDILMPGIPITINFDCGYDDLGALQNWEGFGALVQGMKLVIADAWENRVPPDNVNNREVMNVVEKWLCQYRVYD